MRKNMFAFGLLGVVLASGCALGSNAPGRAAGAVKDGARRETIGNVASGNFTRQLYGSSAVRSVTPAGAVGADPVSVVPAAVVPWTRAQDPAPAGPGRGSG